jgi:hypothetical protein
VQEHDFQRDGHSVHADVLAPALVAPVSAAFAQLLADGAGERAALSHPAIEALARSHEVRRLVEPVLGAAAFAFRATLFDKYADRNWPVAWHQDRTVPVQRRIDAAGYRNWSHKGAVWFCEPPRSAHQDHLAVRVDLDGSGPDNGGLRVLPASHRDGVLTPEQVAAAVAERSPRCPEVVAGGALRMRPLLLHSSRRSLVAGHRRVVHFEFAARELPGGVRFAARIGAAQE